MEIKKILFPTDFSEGSSYALQYAIDMVKHYGAKLYVIHVIYDIAKTASWYVPNVSVEEMYKDVEKGAKNQLEKFCNEELKGIKDVDHAILTGVPHDEIVKFAKENKIDLIVMGSHGRKGIDRIIFGSTAAQVVRFAPCPVLTVRLLMH